MEKHHEFDRYKDRELERMLKSPDYSPEGDRVYKGLLEDLSKRDEPKPEPREGYQPKEWDKEQALKHLPPDEKISRDGQTYTKFSDLESLKDLAERLESGKSQWLERDEYQKLYHWIGTKNNAGDDFFEKKAKANWDRKERKKEKKLDRQPDEDQREFRKLDKDLKKSIKEMDREGSLDGLGRGHRERQREMKGRMGAEHGHVTANETIERLKRQSEAEPSRKVEIDLQIEDVKRWDQEQRDTSSRFKDLDSMLGDRYGRDQKELGELLKPSQRHYDEFKTPQNDQSLDLDKTDGPTKTLDQDLEKQNDQKQDLEKSAETQTDGKWQELDSMLGERFGPDDRSEKDLAKAQQVAQSNQQMRQFQDLHNSQEQTPEQAQELSRDDGEDFFARGER